MYLEESVSKYKCGGTCGKSLPEAISVSVAAHTGIGEVCRERVNWRLADAMAKDVMGYLLTQGLGTGSLLWEAGRALMECEYCETSYCIDCYGGKSHVHVEHP
jgi:hypothetical protein